MHIMYSDHIHLHYFLLLLLDNPVPTSCFISLLNTINSQVHMGMGLFTGSWSTYQVTSPSSHQLSIVPQIGVGITCPFSTHAGMLTNLILYWPYAGNYSCQELVGVMALSCPEDTVLKQSSTNSDSYQFSSPLLHVP